MMNIFEGFNGVQKKNARIIFALLLLILLIYTIKPAIKM